MADLERSAIYKWVNKECGYLVMTGVACFKDVTITSHKVTIMPCWGEDVKLEFNVKDITMTQLANTINIYLDRFGNTHRITCWISKLQRLKGVAIKIALKDP